MIMMSIKNVHKILTDLSIGTVSEISETSQISEVDESIFFINASLAQFL